MIFSGIFERHPRLMLATVEPSFGRQIVLVQRRVRDGLPEIGKTLLDALGYAQ